jgi:hypothetical protein
MGFVEAVESSSPQSDAKPQSTEPAKSAEPEKASSLEGAAPAPEESHKKFTKKY